MNSNGSLFFFTMRANLNRIAGWSMNGLSNTFFLTCPFETCFDCNTSSHRSACKHAPAFMIQMREDNKKTLVFLVKSILNRHSYLCHRINSDQKNQGILPIQMGAWAVPAKEEYDGLICFVSTPSVRSIKSIDRPPSVHTAVEKSNLQNDLILTCLFFT